MRRSQQQTSRIRSARIFMRTMERRKQKAQWRSVVVRPLKMRGKNSRINRMRRRKFLLGW